MAGDFVAHWNCAVMLTTAIFPFFLRRKESDMAGTNMTQPRRFFGFVVPVVTVQYPDRSGRLLPKNVLRPRGVPRKRDFRGGARKKHA